MLFHWLLPVKIVLLSNDHLLPVMLSNPRSTGLLLRYMSHEIEGMVAMTE